MSEADNKKTRAKAGDRRSGGPARMVSAIIPDIGRASFRRFGFVQSAVISRWVEIVGPRYAAVSAPESIRFPHGQRASGTLTLCVSGPYAAMMQHVAPEIIERVNRFFGYPAVTRLSIRQGEVQTRQAPPAPAPKPHAPLPEDLGSSLRAVSDPELRAVLEALAQGVAASAGIPHIKGDE